MTDLFLKVLNVSISASYLVLAVVVLRLCLKKAPKWVWPLLWGVVALRMLCPVFLESRVSMIPDPEPVNRETFVQNMPAFQFETPTDRQINTVNAAYGEYVEVKTELGPDEVLAMVWLAGAAGMVLYTVGSYWSLRRRVGRAKRDRDHVYESENVASPFVLGLFRPRIYLPLGLSEQERFYILAHEQAHIRRRDHWWKPLGFMLLAVHWFNPLMWLAYVLLCRDIELACDEKVIGQLGREGRADYSQALLSCAVRHRSIAACPLAFGEVGVKQRVKSVLSYKKPAFWVVLLAVIASIVVSVCFLTNPKQAENGRLTLEQVLELAKKGEHLTGADLEGYEYEDIGSGQYIPAYYVGEDYVLVYYRSGDEGPGMFKLQCCADGAQVDLLEEANLERFLEVHNGPLNEGDRVHGNPVLDLGITTPTGTQLYIGWDGTEEPLELSCPEDYTLWKKNSRGKWEQLPSQIPPVPESERLEPGVQVQQRLDWTDRYGVLRDGEYQLRKWADYRDYGVSHSMELSAEFRVSADGKPQLTGAELVQRSDWLEVNNRDHREAFGQQRPKWADYEDWAYAEEVGTVGIQRHYPMDNGLTLIITGFLEDERPNNLTVSNGIETEIMMLNAMNSQEALAYGIDLLSQPLSQGQQDHIGLQLVIDSYSAAGATVSIEGQTPSNIQVVPNYFYSLQTLNDRGQWEDMPDLEGDTGVQVQFLDTVPTTRTLDWQERYGILAPGTYRIHFDTDTTYVNGEVRSSLGMISGELTAVFTIGQSQQAALEAKAQPFDPSQVYDLTQAVLCLSDTEYVLTEGEDLRYLEQILSGAQPEKGRPGCPFSSTAYLTRSDGTVLSFQHAEDGCAALVVGESSYTYDVGLGQDFWTTFGIIQYETRAVYDDQGRVIRHDDYAWGSRIPNSTIEYTYDEAGNLTIVEHRNDDGTTSQKMIYEYDDRGNQIAWWNYSGMDKLWSRGERTFDEDNNLIEEKSYRGDMLYLGTAYVHDDRGRLREEIHTMRGEPDGSARYEWQSDNAYRVYHYGADGALQNTEVYVLDDQGRTIRREFISAQWGNEGWREYEYPEGETDRRIVRYYDRDGKLTEEGWENMD